MLNKKAIAVFAAAATLLSGLAFSTPAMADDYSNDSQEEDVDNLILEVLSRANEIVSAGDTNAKGYAEAKALLEVNHEICEAKAKWVAALDEVDNASTEEEKAAAQNKADEAESYYLSLHHPKFDGALNRFVAAIDYFGHSQKNSESADTQSVDTSIPHRVDNSKADNNKTDSDKIDSDKIDSNKTDSNKTTKLPNTGSSVVLAAVTASMLAGIGAVLCKSRH